LAERHPRIVQMIEHAEFHAQLLPGRGALRPASFDRFIAWRKRTGSPAACR
jgi:hypothetical protein